MKTILTFLLALFIGQGFTQRENLSGFDQMLTEEYQHTVPVIRPNELYKRIKAGEKIHVLDSRERAEFEVSAIKGALFIGTALTKIDKIKGVKKSDFILVYCTVGVRSELMAEHLIKNGFTNVYNLYGGIIQWKNQGFPVYKNNIETENVHVYSEEWSQWLLKGKAQF